MATWKGHAALSIPRPLHAAIKRKAAEAGMPMTQYVMNLVGDKSRTIEVERTPPTRDVLLRMVASDPHPDTVHAVSHLLRRLPS